jgi:hypothetical protein
LSKGRFRFGLTGFGVEEEAGAGVDTKMGFKEAEVGPGTGKFLVSRTTKKRPCRIFIIKMPSLKRHPEGHAENGPSEPA